LYAYIKGIVDEIGVDRAVVEAAGVGYELFCSSTTLKQLQKGKTAKLHTHFHLAEGVMALYGFADPAERAMFRRLIGVTRVGPKLALSVLSSLTVSDVAAAVLTENIAAFDKVSGMGRKTAARVLLELKEKIGKDEFTEYSGGFQAPATQEAQDLRTEAVAALVSLGYDGVSAGRAVAAVPDCERIEDMITQALKQLAIKVK